MEEVWKDIFGYEGVYQVSNWGRIKALFKIDALGRIKSEKILKPKGTGVNTAYRGIGLYKNGECKQYLVHRLVASAFLPQIEGKDIVNHKDSNPSNNFISNLEWCNQSENVLQAVKNGNHKPPQKGKFGSNHNTAKPIVQMDLQGNEIQTFGSVVEAKRALNIKSNDLSSACSGKRKTYHGFTWKYSNQTV